MGGLFVFFGAGIYSSPSALRPNFRSFCGFVCLYLIVTAVSHGGATLVLFVIGVLTLIVLIYWLLKGKRGALQAVTFTALLLFGTQFAQTVSANLDSVLAVFLFGAGAALVAFLLTWLLSWLVDTTRKRRSRMHTKVA